MISLPFSRSLTRRVLPSLVIGMVVSLSAVAQDAPKSPAEDEKPAADTASAPSTAPAETKSDEADVNASPEGETLILSPFEVVSDTRGYFSANTMSGTRLNTRIEDLASSISVVTKEQMSDFAMLDINDIFLYTAGTEGTETYTDLTVDRNGQITDNSQGNPNGANRIRGISSANISYGNFETSGRTPIDPMIIDGVEVSRGPNANVFGLGNPSGTVNQVPSNANTSRNHYTVKARGDSYGGWRSSFDLNRVLIKNKLAVRVNGSTQHDTWQRKPTGFWSKRLDAMVKFQPFSKTKFTFSYMYYYGYGNRPNNTTPRDYVSAWVDAGKPGWDPTTQLITLDGVTYGANASTNPTGIVAGSTIPITDAMFALPQASYETDAVANARRVFSRSGGGFSRSNLFVDQTGVIYWSAPTGNSGATPTTGSTADRLVAANSSTKYVASVVGRFDAQPLFTTTPGVNNQNLYDWSKINLSAIDTFADRTDTYLAQLDQVFISTPVQSLSGSASFFREDAERYRRTPASNSGTSGQTGQLLVDTNLRNLDGTPNPNFGRPFIGVVEPRTTLSPLRWDTYRGQLAYRINLTGEKNWLRWLGLHTISAYYDYKYRINRQYSYRDVMTSDTPWIDAALNPTIARGNQSNNTLPGVPQAGPNVMRLAIRYYVGDANGSNVDYAPTSFQYGNYPFVWGTTGSWHYDPIQLGQVATTDGSGYTANQKQIIKTPGAVVQSHFLNDSIVTTFGVRKDQVYSQWGAYPQLLTGDAAAAAGVNENTAFNYNVIDHWSGNWQYNSGRTTTAGVVLRPFKDLPFVNRWAQTGTGATSLLGDFLRGLSLTFNRSNNFIPQPPAVDLYQNPLPNITGDGTDIGVWVNMFNGKLVIRFNHYVNNQYNARNGDANTLAQRVLRHDIDVGQSDAFKLYTQATNWITAQNPTWNSAQVQAEVFNQIKLDPDRYSALVTDFQNGTLAATNDITGKGNELEINFNPSTYWTITANATDTQAINSNVSSSIQRYINERAPVWLTIVDPTINDSGNPNNNTPTSATTEGFPDLIIPANSWWRHNYGGSQTAQQNFLSFVQAPLEVITETQGKSQPTLSRYSFRLSTNLQLAAVTNRHVWKDIHVGGAIRWQSKQAIGYYGVDYQELLANQLPINHLDPNNPIWEGDQWYFDAFISYRTRFFHNRIGATFQLNVKNIQEPGGLKPIRAFPDGSAYAWRIIDPRQFIFSTTFDY